MKFKKFREVELYPLKFTPLLKERIWGGKRLETYLGKDLGGKGNIGESWELSAVEGNVSVVSNGELTGNDLLELVEIYMGDLVGEKVFEKYGLEFPLLIKLIDANDDLSIQVHPDDKAARERHHAWGKTEMWVALAGDNTTQLISGFKHDTDREEFLQKLEDGSLPDLFNYEQVSKGDVFFVPSGRVHAICSGNLIAEIQQTSDVTYRIFDYNRKDTAGNSRELHLDLALEVMDYSKVMNPKKTLAREVNKPVELAKCAYFTTNRIDLTLPIERDYYANDSFTILICVEGKCTVGKKGCRQETFNMGETILIPASLNSIRIEPETPRVSLLEVYIQ
ncbi:MAG: class I mannose-6-phosphate isomerase [Prolixibacteraceae bacterium]|nr:class I mannose-6-phosphate isomerase [Prolixibacteraceae bacterium]